MNTILKRTIQLAGKRTVVEFKFDDEGKLAEIWAYGMIYEPTKPNPRYM